MGRRAELTGLVVGTTLALAARQAPAQGFAMQGRTVVSIEHISAASYDRYRLEAADSDQTTTSDWFSVGLLGVDAQGLGSIPRVAADYFMDGYTTVGLGAVYLMRTGSTTIELKNGAPSEEQENPTLHTVLVNPRFGCAIPIGYRSAIWSRVGGTWVGEFQQGDDARRNLNLIELWADVLWVVSLADFLALSVGPFLDLGLLGQYDLHESGESRTEYASASSVGLTVAVSALSH